MLYLLPLVFSLVAASALAQDVDRDGIDDRLEQALLDRFAPTFMLAAGECDGFPASFEPHTADPVVLKKDGTIYGQAFPAGDPSGLRIELHYFHLWANDCGRLGHALDVEHVSALVGADTWDAPADRWKADAWYAAAHEDSVCDASSGAQARALGSVRAGPTVFVSRGKHASYFNREHCKWGCGGDVCSGDIPLIATWVVNIGEKGAPLNGATWIHSSRWPMSEKLTSDFDGDLRARLDRAGPERIIALRLHMRAPQSPVLAGDTALDGLGVAARSTSSAVKKSAHAVTRFLGLKPR